MPRFYSDDHDFPTESGQWALRADYEALAAELAAANARAEQAETRLKICKERLEIQERLAAESQESALRTDEEANKIFDNLEAAQAELARVRETMGWLDVLAMETARKIKMIDMDVNSKMTITLLVAGVRLLYATVEPEQVTK